MFLDKRMYVPALRWRQGEYQALFRLADAAKARTVPLITIPEVEFDFEMRTPNRTVQEHLDPFAKRFHAKWDHRPAWIGVHPGIAEKSVDDGRDIYAFVFESLREFGACTVPAIPLRATHPVVASVGDIIATDGRGVAIMVRLLNLMQPNTRSHIDRMAASLGVSIDEVDLIVDLLATNFEPYDVFASALAGSLDQLGNLFDFRNLVVIGTAIPKTFKDVASGTDHLPRHDWLFYQEFTRRLPTDLRLPNYGDYTVVHPEFKPLDMRKIKAAGKLVYTTPKTWEVRKGRAFRDHPAQMHEHCASLVASGKFSGAAYSYGDDYIARCAVREAKPSNQTRWKGVAINHHITHVLDDLSRLDDASCTPGLSR